MVLHHLVILLVVLLTKSPIAAPCELLPLHELLIEEYDDKQQVFLSLSDWTIAVEANQTVRIYRFDAVDRALQLQRGTPLPRHVLANRTLVRLTSAKVIRVLLYDDFLFLYPIQLQEEGEAFSLSADGSRLLVGLRLLLLNHQEPHELGTIGYNDTTIMSPVVSTLSPSGDTMAVLLSPKSIGIFEYDNENNMTSLRSIIDVNSSVNKIYLSTDATFMLVQLDRDVVVFEHDISSNAWIEVQVLFDTVEISLSLDARVISGRQTNGYLVYRKTMSSTWKIIWQDSSAAVDAVDISDNGAALAVASGGTVTIHQLPDCLWATLSPTISPAPSMAPSRPPNRLETISAASVCGIAIEWKEPQPILWNHEEIQRWESFTASWFERFFTSEFIDVHEYAVTNVRSRVTLVLQTADNITYDQTMSYDLWDENVTAEEIVLLPSERRWWRRRYYNELFIAIPMPEELHDEPFLLDNNATCDPSNSLIFDEITNAPSPIGRSPVAAFINEDDSESSMMVVYISAAVGGVAVLFCGMLLILYCRPDGSGKQFPQDSSCPVDGVSIHTVSAIPVPVEILGDRTVLPHNLPQFKDQVQSIPLAESTPAGDEFPH